ncbi:O-antigen ligase family protein [Flavobacteriaceae bacterium]|nr:O-antigen ligase family protein [Flavobacteriaceae bacterium]
MQYSRYYRFLLIILGFGLGFLMLNSMVSKLIIHGLAVLSLLHVFFSKNKQNEALLWAGIFVSLEVAARMTGGFFFWEFGKYFNILLLTFGLLISENQRVYPVIFILIILFLLIGIAFSDIPPGESIRKVVAFNLSGPLQLCIASIYTFKRKLSMDELLEFMFYWLVALFPILSILYFRTPSITEIVFGGSSNFETSGGFGPNQVSTMLGYGVFILTSLIILKRRITGFRVIDYLLLAYFIYRALLTFSRGGVIAATIAIIIFLLFHLSTNPNRILNIGRYIIIGSVFISGIYVFTSDITGGMLDNRYTNKNARGIEKEDITSGRSKIFSTQLESWFTNPFFGIGVGSGKYKRMEMEEGLTAASHNEVSRLLEEHGLIGFVILITLILVSLKSIGIQNFSNWGILLSFLSLWFLTINHSAMRTAFPGFMYALSLLTLINSNEHTVSRE